MLPSLFSRACSHSLLWVYFDFPNIFVHTKLFVSFHDDMWFRGCSIFRCSLINPPRVSQKFMFIFDFLNCMMIKWCLNEHSRMFYVQVFTRRLPTMRDQNRDSLAQIIFTHSKRFPDLKENDPIQNDDQDLQRNVSIICLSRELEATILEFMIECHSVSQIWRKNISIQSVKYEEKI